MVLKLEEFIAPLQRAGGVLSGLPLSRQHE
jgi:hypothetical protein